MAESGSSLGTEDRERYSRQLAMPEIGEEGQDRLRRSRVAIVGVGGLGSPAALYLAAAGVGELVLIDPDPVELSNLNRQIAHGEEDLNRPKVESGERAVRRLNKKVMVHPVSESINVGNVSRILQDATIVLDCMDDYPSRMVVNKHCVHERLTLVHAAVEGWRGQVLTILPGKGPCLNCLIHNPPIRSSLIPVLGAAAGVFGSLQAAEAIKVIIGRGDPLFHSLLVGDIASNTWETVPVSRRPGCETCGHLA